MIRKSGEGLISPDFLYFKSPVTLVFETTEFEKNQIPVFRVLSSLVLCTLLRIWKLILSKYFVFGVVSNSP